MCKEKILHYIFSRLAGGQNIALIEPSIGHKTKLLQDISNPNIYSEWIPNKSEWIFAYLSASQFELDDTTADFWRRIWQAFVNQTENKPYHFLINELVSNPFSSLLSNRILRQLDKQRVRLILLFDDLDKLILRTCLFTPDLLGPLRSYSSRYLSFNVVFSSQHRISELNRKVVIYGSPPFNNFNELLISDYIPL